MKQNCAWFTREATNLICSIKFDIVSHNGILQWNEEKSLIDYYQLTKDVIASKPTNISLEPSQKLRLSKTPVGVVINMVLNRSESILALIEEDGAIIVVPLPERGLKGGLFASGDNVVLVRSFSLQTEVFPQMRFMRKKVRQARWHPGSSTDTHLVVLSEDDVLRIYDVTKRSEAVSLVHIPVNVPEETDCGNRNIASALGLVAVSFDFGPPLKPSSGQEFALSQELILLWPIYVASGDGFVWQVDTCVAGEVTNLVMYPPSPVPLYPHAEDNYHMDVCSLSIIPDTSPPLMIIASAGDGVRMKGTSASFLHCLLLPNEGFGSNTLENCNASQALYVFERMDLGFYLEEDEAETIDMDYPISIIPEPFQGTACVRYLCLHPAGVHSVSIAASELFNLADPLKDMVNSSGFFDDVFGRKSSVYHLFCTRPRHGNSSTKSTCGLAMFPRAFRQAPFFVCLSNSDQFTFLSLKFNSERTSSLLIREESKDSIEQSGSFLTHVEKLLERDVSNPILCLSEEGDEEAFLSVLSRSVSTLHVHYMDKQRVVVGTISRRVDLVRTQTSSLCKLLDNLRTTISQCSANYTRLKERLKETQEDQAVLMKKLETVSRLIVSQLPVRSLKEVEFASKLKVVKKSLYRAEQRSRSLKSTVQSKAGSTKVTDLPPRYQFLTKAMEESVLKMLQLEQKRLDSLVALVNKISLHVGL